MPEYVKALIVVLVIGAAVFALGERYLDADIVSRADYRRRAVVWLGVTAAAFLSHSYWLFVIVAGTLLTYGGAKDTNPMGFYCALLFAVPPFGSSITGLGILNYFFDLNYLRLLSLAVLLPAAWKLFHARQLHTGVPKFPDALLAAYLLLLFALTVVYVPFTTALRQAFYLFIDVWLLYYVASRSVRELSQMRSVVAAFVLGATIIAAIAVFESVRGWLLYSTLSSLLDVSWGYGAYMGRGDEGSLRATASTGHPIVMGYVMVVALPLLIFLKPSIRFRLIWWLALAVLIGALLATHSRGPWLGAAAMAVVAAVGGRGAIKRIGLLAIGTGAFLAMAMLFGIGRSVLDQLPFVGTVGSESIEYRQKLFDVSIRILMNSPLLGSPGFYANAAAQELRGGEGIIDMVNSYLAVAVASGFIGLALFVGLLVCAAVLAWRTSRFGDRVPRAAALGRAMLAAIAGIAVTIATTSSINVIEPIYYLVIGLGVGCLGTLVAKGPLSEVSENPPASPVSRRFGLATETDTRWRHAGR